MRFLLFFNGEAVNPKPAEEVVLMQQWADWFRGMLDDGIFESILPYNRPGKIVTSKRVLWYYEDHALYAGCVINVKSEKEAIEVAKKAPFVLRGGSIVVKQCLKVVA